MWPLPINELFYIGYSTEQKLRNYGITTIGELAHSDPEWIKKTLKAYGLMIWQFANGIADQMDKMTFSPVNKGYGNSITISFDISDANYAKSVLLFLSETVSSRIRADHAYISVVSVTIVDYDFKYVGHQMNLHAPTDITRQIYEAACQLFNEMWNHMPIRQLGVHTSNATASSMYQYSIFDSLDIDKEVKLDRAVDKIRSTWGENAIKRGTLLNSSITSAPTAFMH